MGVPHWLHCDMDDGTLSVKEPVPSFEPYDLRISLAASEGVVGEADCGITQEQFRGLSSPWAKSTIAIVHLLSDGGRCKLEKAYMDIIRLHLEEVYDFKARTIKDVPLGLWL